MNLPKGIEFVISEAVPREQGLRRLTDRTFECHPDAYQALLSLFGNLERLAAAFSALGALAEAVWAFGRLAEALDRLKKTGDGPQPQEDAR